MQTIRATQINLREGSTGAEAISASYKVLLFSAWYGGYTNPQSIVFLLLANFRPSAWVLLVVGVVHILSLTQPVTLPIRVVRKACSCVGISIWSSSIVDLAASTQGISALALLYILMIVFLGVSVVRRVYPVV